MATKRGPRLASLADCQSLLAKVIRQTMTGEMSPSLAGRLGYLLSIMQRGFALQGTDQPSGAEPTGETYLANRRAAALLLDNPLIAGEIDKLLDG